MVLLESRRQPELLPAFDRALPNCLCLPGIVYRRSSQVLLGEVVVLNADLPCLASLIKLAWYFRIILHSEPSTLLRSLDVDTLDLHNNK